MFEIGQKLRVKTREEILKTLDDGKHGEHQGINWNDRSMSRFCGQTGTVIEIETWCNRPAYSFKEFNDDGFWIFQEDWVQSAYEVKLPEDLFTL